MRERRGRVEGRSTGGGVPPFLFMQSQSPKDIARSDITDCLWHIYAVAREDQTLVVINLCPKTYQFFKDYFVITCLYHFLLAPRCCSKSQQKQPSHLSGNLSYTRIYSLSWERLYTYVHKTKWCPKQSHKHFMTHYLKVVKKWWAGALLSVKRCCFVPKLR